MFLLIFLPLDAAGCCPDFNTSHVSINLGAALEIPHDILNFNTSHVSINRQLAARWAALKMISIHLMFLLIVKL